MEENKNTYNNIDEYIMLFPEDIQTKLQEIRNVIKKAAPEAVEKISWKMPTFYLYGNLVHFAAHKNHIGIYPGARGIEVFQNRFTEYKSSKGAVQFPLDKPLPFDLITEIVQFRVDENLKEAESKPKVKKYYNKDEIADK